MSHEISRRVPEIFCRGDIDAAERLIKREGGSSFYLPELLALLAMPSVPRNKVIEWAGALAGTDVSGDRAFDFGMALGKIGVFVFSFPIWRFLADRVKRGDGSCAPALLESFGMTRFTRESDAWFGSGFVRCFAGAKVEYRRAYVRVSMWKGGGHLFIRNSSHYWGRDRLTHAAYFSPNNNIPAPFPSVAWWRHASRLRTLVDTITAFEDRLSHWFFDGRGPGSGFQPLLESLSLRMKRPKPPVLGFIHPDFPPWCPYASLQVSEKVLLDIAQGGSHADAFFKTGIARNAKLVLMSGEHGDFPVRE